MSDPQAIEPGPDHSPGGSRQGSRVVFFTDTHRIMADVDTGQRRLVEVLRDSTRAYIDITRLSLSRTAEPSQLIGSSARGVLRKSDVLLAAILSETARPERRLYSYVSKASVRVQALLPSCSIIGDMHLPEGTTDGVLAYMKMADTFIHLTNAEIRFTRTWLPPSTASTVVVNRSSVEMLCLAA